VTQYGNLFVKSKPILDGLAALRSLVDWKKPFEAKRFSAGNIKVTREPRVIVRIRLPAVGGVILLAVKMKMHSWDGNTIGACCRIESSSAIIGPTVDDSGHLENSSSWSVTVTIRSSRISLAPDQIILPRHVTRQGLFIR